MCVRVSRTHLQGDDHLHTAGCRRERDGLPVEVRPPARATEITILLSCSKKRKVGGGLHYSSESNRYSALVRSRCAVAA